MNSMAWSRNYSEILMSLMFYEMVHEATTATTSRHNDQLNLPVLRHPRLLKPAFLCSIIRQGCEPRVYIREEDLASFERERDAAPASWHWNDGENLWYVYCMCMPPHVAPPEPPPVKAVSRWQEAFEDLAGGSEFARVRGPAASPAGS